MGPTAQVYRTVLRSSHGSTYPGVLWELWAKLVNCEKGEGAVGSALGGVLCRKLPEVSFKANMGHISCICYKLGEDPLFSEANDLQVQGNLLVTPAR